MRDLVCVHVCIAVQVSESSVYIVITVQIYRNVCSGRMTTKTLKQAVVFDFLHDLDCVVFYLTELRMF